MKNEKKHALLLLLICCLTMFVAAGCGDKSNEKTSQEEVVKTFSAVTESENFKNVPIMKVANTKISEAADYGGGVDVIYVDGTKLEDYQSYLATLEKDGYTKYVDNGETGLAETVYSATYTKDSQVVTVSHAVNINRTYIASGENINLSENLIYKDEYVQDNKEGAQTTLHMLEQYESGNSFVIQLKNGHFIILDGAEEQDAPYLLEYLKSLAPVGEKPVIEAWIISHAHHDHYDCFYEMGKNESYNKSIIVNGVYYSATSDAAALLSDGNTEGRDRIVMYALNFRDEDGNRTQVYRPQFGQRYYFSDITMDIVFTQEQLLQDPSYVWYNDVSTWCMFNIEGQKFLHAGDADHWSQDAVMGIYNSDYFNLDILAAFHHGLNIFDRFTDFCTLKTVLYPCYRVGSYHVGDQWERQAENDHLVASAEEAMSWGDGTKVLTFPYKVGSYKTLPLRKWGARGELLIIKE